MGPPLRVLIVEDSIDDAELVLRQLRRAGYDPVSERVQTAEEMKVALEREAWDLVVSDYSMPQFDAPTALDLLSQSGRDLPFIIVSGSIGEDIAVAMMKTGAHDYLLKQNLTRFVPAVQRELREAENRRQQRLTEQAKQRLQIERDGLLERLKQENEDLTALTQVTANAISTLELDELLDVLQGRIVEVMHADAATILLAEGDELRVRASVGAVDLSDSTYVARVGEGFAGSVASGMEPMYVEDARQDPLVKDPLIRERGIRSMLGVPLKRNGALIGVLHVDWLTVRACREREVHLLEITAERCAAAIQNSQLYQEAKRIAAALTKSEARLRQLSSAIEQTADAVMITNRDGMIQYVNAAFEGITGYRASEVVGRKPSLLTSGQHPPEFFEHLWRTITTGAAFRAVVVNRRKDGALLYEQMTITPIKDQRGIITQFVSTSTDITDLKRAERQSTSEHRVLELLARGLPLAEALEGLTREYEQLFPGMLCSVLLLDADGRHLRHGYAPSLPAAYIAAIDGIEIGPRVGSCGTAAYTGRTVIVSDIATDPLWAGCKELALPQGLRACCSVPILGEEGRVLGTFALYFREPRVPQPEELAAFERAAHLASLAILQHRTLGALRHSEERFRELAETIEDVFWITDPAETRMLYISPGYEKIWGRSCQSLYDDPRSWLEAVHPDERERVLSAATTRQIDRSYDEEYRIVRPDGTVRWIRDRAFPVCDASGQVLRVVGVGRDITEQRRLEEQFRQSQKLEAIGQLAGGVAHDFNNLLTVIHGHAALILQGRPNASDDIVDSARQIEETAERAANLTRQLLAFSRRQVLQPLWLDLNDNIAGLTKMLQRILGEDVHLQLHLHPRSLMTRADPGMLDQILLNLVVNARDAMPNGGRLIIDTTEKELTAEEAHSIPDAKAGRYVCFRVTDTGCGISPENLSRIFEPFFTTKDPGKGTGLGLATVFGIVRQHLGWLKVDSKVGSGTTFEIFLPAGEPPAAEARVAEAAKPKPRGGTETILVVEDEPSVRMLARVLLERHGYRVLEAADGVEAEKVWREHGPGIALLLTDLVMPGGLSGLELATQLQAEKPDLKVILTSGYSADFAGQDLNLGTAHGFLQKPWVLEQLLATIREVLDAHA